MKVPSIQCLCFVMVVIKILAGSPVVNGRRNFDNVEITTTQLDDNLCYLQGQGGQIGVLAGPDGILMVDTQFAPLTDRIVACDTGDLNRADQVCAQRARTRRPFRWQFQSHCDGRDRHDTRRAARRTGRLAEPA